MVVVSVLPVVMVVLNSEGITGHNNGADSGGNVSEAPTNAE